MDVWTFITASASLSQTKTEELSRYLCRAFMRMSKSCRPFGELKMSSVLV